MWQAENAPAASMALRQSERAATPRDCPTRAARSGSRRPVLSILLIVFVAAITGTAGLGNNVAWDIGDVAVLTFPPQVLIFDASLTTRKDVLDLSTICAATSQSGLRFDIDASRLLVPCQTNIGNDNLILFIDATGTQHDIIGNATSCNGRAVADVEFDEAGQIYSSTFVAFEGLCVYAPNGTVLQSNYLLSTAAFQNNFGYSCADNGSFLLLDTDSGFKNVLSVPLATGVVAQTTAKPGILPFGSGLLGALPGSSSVFFASTCLYNVALGASNATPPIDQFCNPPFTFGGSTSYSPDGQTIYWVVAIGTGFVYSAPKFSLNKTTISANTTDPAVGVAVRGGTIARLCSTLVPVSVSAVSNGPATVAVGTTYNVTITVVVGGGGTALDVVVTAHLPPGLALVGAPPPNCALLGAPPSQNLTCSLGNVSAPVTNITVKLNATAPSGPAGVVVAVSAFNDVDKSNPTSNTATTAPTTIVPLVPVSVSAVSNGPATVAVGTTYNVTITVVVGGGGTALDVVVTAHLPPGLALVGAPPPNCALLGAPPSQNLTCSLGNVSAPVTTITVKLNATAPSGPAGVVVAVSAFNDANPSNGNTATTTPTRVVPRAVFCVSGGCCNLTASTLMPAGTVCVWQAPSSGGGAFALPTSTRGDLEECRRAARSCGAASLAQCSGICSVAGACVLQPSNNSKKKKKCCKLPNNNFCYCVSRTKHHG